MLIYQYAYFALRESDKRAGLSRGLTKIKAITLFIVFESFLFMTIYGWIDIMHGPPLHNLPTSFGIVFPYLLVLTYINTIILGSQEREQQYCKMFESWDNRKRQRWTCYIVAIVASIFVSFFILIEVSQSMRQ